MKQFKQAAVVAAVVIVAAGATAIARADQSGTPAPHGTKGKDYDLQVINIAQGAQVDIVAVNNTQNTQPGNTSSVVLYIDNVEVGRDGGERANSKFEYLYKQPGQHTLMTQCFNTHADAFICALNLQTVSVVQGSSFFPGKAGPSQGWDPRRPEQRLPKSARESVPLA